MLFPFALRQRFKRITGPDDWSSSRPSFLRRKSSPGESRLSNERIQLV